MNCTVVFFKRTVCVKIVPWCGLEGVGPGGGLHGRGRRVVQTRVLLHTQREERKEKRKGEWVGCKVGQEEGPEETVLVGVVSSYMTVDLNIQTAEGGF